MSKKYKFINGYDDFMVDLLELNNSKYNENKMEDSHYVIMFYNPANHRYFTKLLNSKKASETNNALMEFL